jgi:hypothetical protein
VQLGQRVTLIVEEDRVALRQAPAFDEGTPPSALPEAVNTINREE